MSNSEGARPFARVRRDDLEAFLRREGEFWEVDANPGFEECVTVRPLSVDDLLAAIECYAPNSNLVYAFSDLDVEAWEGGINPDDAPIIGESELNEFIIRCVRGDDFLWIAPSAEDAANASYITILPSEGPVVEAIEDEPQVEGAPRGPRLTSLAIENFKGIGRRIDIELRPITLLFGPNSAGKSTVLHALHYAREILLRRNLNATQSGYDRPPPDLGGFTAFVHNHDTQREIHLGIGLEVRDADLPNYWGSIPPGAPIGEPEDLLRKIDSAKVELRVAWSEMLRRPFASGFGMFLDGAPLGQIEMRPGSPDCLLSINAEHRSWARARENTTIWSWHPLAPEEIDEAKTATDELIGWAKHAGVITAGVGSGPFTCQLGIVRQQDSLPDLDRALRLAGGWHGFAVDPQLLGAGLSEMVDYLADGISKAVLGPAAILRGLLSALRCIGPIRVVPPRDYSMQRRTESGHWSDGLWAWDELLSDDDRLLDSVNEWLSRDDRLDTGYRIAHRRSKAITLEQFESIGYVLESLENLDMDAARAAIRGQLQNAHDVDRLVLEDVEREIDVEPYDVGVGIAQLVPVVVAALSGRGVLNVIEQPELHVHPRLQAALGDLFIEACRTRDQRFIIETHSEHLILRLLRRIRETGKGSAHREMAITPDDVAVYYVAAEGTQTKVQKIDIDTRGEFVQPWPDDFFEIDFHERFA